MILPAPIATRSLVLVEGRETRRVEIVVFAPEPVGKDYNCRYEIHWPAEVWQNHGLGVDSIQALVLALHKIGVDLNSSEAGKEGRLGWFDPGDGVGFPVPGKVRDVLRGRDRKLF